MLKHQFVGFVRGQLSFHTFGIVFGSVDSFLLRSASCWMSSRLSFFVKHNASRSKNKCLCLRHHSKLQPLEPCKTTGWISRILTKAVLFFFQKNVQLRIRFFRFLSTASALLLIYTTASSRTGYLVWTSVDVSMKPATIWNVATL